MGWVTSHLTPQFLFRVLQTAPIGASLGRWKTPSNLEIR